MRVLVAAHHYPPHVGGIEVVARAEARGLLRLGDSVEVLTSDGGAPAGTVVEDGVRVTRVRAWHGLEGRGVPFPVFAPSLLPAAWRAVRRADVVHVHDTLYLVCWVVALVARLTRTPYVVHRHVAVVAHPSRVVGLVQALVNRTTGRFVVSGARRVLAIDDLVADNARRLGADPARTVVLRNAVDTTMFRPAGAGERDLIRAELGLPPALPLVLFVGRFVPKKGFAEFVDAVDHAHVLVLVGGERPDDLADDPRRVFLGELGREQVARVYRACDLFVGASVGEGPLTTLEALASGLPVLHQDEPGYTGLDLPGVAADLRDGSLVTRVRALLADPGRLAELAVAGRAAAEQRYSWESHVAALREIYLLAQS